MKKVNIFLYTSYLLLIFSFLIFRAKAEPNNYIYLDLNCGDVTINESTYSGCIFQTIDGVTTQLTVSDDHHESNYYYIYQSNDNNKATTGLIDDVMVIPAYDDLSEVVNTFVNNTDVESVIKTWDTKAQGIGRSSTGKKIIISGNSVYDITIDNLWSSYHVKGENRRHGGIAVTPNTGMKATIRLKGDNRFGNIFYTNNSTSSSLEFTSANGNNSTSGSLTVANIVSGASTNHWTSAIGGSDSPEVAKGLKFSGGTIYAGTTTADNCTAIGGGGNGEGEITISGGIITAVSHSTGTAIGGGIGQSSQGGNATVTITGGTVYAYNFGQAYSSSFVPGVAIGGGSSYSSTGNTRTTVTITGGNVYAQSVGGVAIGGGSSATKSGGPATVIISNGASVTAKSVEGTYTYNGVQKQIMPGSGIGGGTGGTSGNGGNATVTISGGEIYSGTIGGGGTNNKSGVVGSATIKIEDGTVHGRIVMHTGTFDMTGGKITSGSAENGGCVQMYGGTATISGGEITNCSATENGGAIYIGGGTFNSNGGIIHNNTATHGSGVFIADGTANITSGSIEQNKATTGNGGGVYIGGNGNFIMTGGKITNNTSLTGNGGGVYLDSGVYNMSAGSIDNNEALNGGGAYVNSANFSLTGGEFNHNKAINNGGGFYIGDNSKVSLSNGNIGNNRATNGAGFYQTQNENDTITTLTGNCNVYNNTANNGNGGGVYIDGGSTFRFVGGKITYNNATTSTIPPAGTLTRESSAGVGGGVYILNGIFTMYDEEDNPGTAAIFGNVSDYAADDLFSSGENTYFDAISVVDMIKADEYKTSDSWFEDFPLNESHSTLNYEDKSDDDPSNDTVVSFGRYKDANSNEEKRVATTVLYRNCEDYIAITMGNSVGNIKISVADENVISTHAFIYKIESCSDKECNELTPEISLEVVISKENKAIITNLPTGYYKISIVPTWSWRYSDTLTFKVIENATQKDPVTSSHVSISVISEQYTEVNTFYEINNKRWLSKTFIQKNSGDL